jgi:hypothetical protein
MLLEIRELGPFSKRAHSTSRKLVKRHYMGKYEHKAPSVTQYTIRKLVIRYWKYGSEAPLANLHVIPVVNQ